MMKALLLSFFFLLLSDSLFGQQHFEWGLGYNQPFYLNQDHSGEISSKTLNYGIAANAGWRKHLSDVYSHSMGLNILNNWFSNEMKYYSSSGSSIETSNYFGSFTSFQCYYEAHIHPRFNRHLSLDLGMNLSNDILRFYKDQNFRDYAFFPSNIVDIRGLLGLTYLFRFSEGMQLGLQLNVSRSIIQYNSSPFDPFFYNSQGTVDARFKISLLKQLNARDSVRNNNKTNNALNAEHRSHHQFAIRPYFLIEYRKFIGDGYEGTLSFNEERTSKYFNYGSGLQLDYSHDRLNARFCLGVNHSENHIEYEQIFVSGGHVGSDWYVTTKRRVNYFEYSNQRLAGNLEVGIKLLKPSYKFNIIPSLAYGLSMSIAQKIVRDEKYSSQSTSYTTPGAPSNFSESTTTPSEFSIQSRNSFLAFGVNFLFQPIQNMNMNAGFFLPINSTPIINSPEHLYEKSSWMVGISVGYVIPIRTSKDVK